MIPTFFVTPKPAPVISDAVRLMALVSLAERLEWGCDLSDARISIRRLCKDTNHSRFSVRMGNTMVTGEEGTVTGVLDAIEQLIKERRKRGVAGVNCHG